MKNLLTYLSILIGSTFAFSQDPVFNNPEFSLTYLNPAYAGENGEITINSQIQNQFHRIAGRFQYSSFSINAGCPNSKHGFGLHVFRSEQGEGFLATNNIYGLYSLTIPTARFSNFTMGIQFGAGQHRLQWDKLTFNSQLDPYLGRISNTSNIFRQNPQSDIFTNFSFGLKYRTLLGKRKKVGNSNPYLSLGFAVFNVNGLSSSNESFFNVINSRQTRYSAHAFFSFVPKKEYSYRSKNNNFRYGLSVNYQSQLPVQTLVSTFQFYPDSYWMVFLGGKTQRFENININAMTLGVSYLHDKPKNFNINFGGNLDFPPFELSAPTGLISFELGMSLTLKNKYMCFKRKNSRNRRIKNLSRDCYYERRNGKIIKVKYYNAQ